MLAFIALSTAYAQVGIGTINPSESAVLELASTERGFLPPRMTTAQRDLIRSPHAGLIIFNISTNAIEFCDGDHWVTYNERAKTPVNTSPEPSGAGDVGIKTKTPNVNAVLDIASTKKGFLPPRLSTNQRNNINNPPAGLLIYNTNTKSLQFYTKANWADFGEVDVVISKTGEIWMDRNLGASQVATSSTDANSYGDLYQWGRTTDGHEKRNSTTSNGPVASGNEGSAFITINSSPFDWLNTQDSNRWNANETIGGDIVKTVDDPCPLGYRIPTEAEWDAERISWSSNDNAGAFSSPLKLPEAGFRIRFNGNLDSVDSLGRYWSSTVSGTDARRLVFNSTTAAVNNRNRADGNSIRCIKD